jgi:hypothetical protein
VSAHSVLRSSGGLHDAEDGLNDGGLPRACAAHNAHFGVGLYSKAEVFEHEGEVGLIPGGEVIELKGGTLGPKRMLIPILFCCNHLIGQPYFLIVGVS